MGLVAALDLKDQKFGMLTALRPSDTKSKYGVLWECLCDCGSTTIALSRSLASGNSKSCGCQHGRKRKEFCDIHGEERIVVGNPDNHKYRCRICRAEKESPLYSSLTSAKQRCINPNNNTYHNYGARGITFYWDSIREAEEWILENLGPKPVGMSLDRIDNNGNYEPGNLRWADRATQNANRRGHCPTCRCEGF